MQNDEILAKLNTIQLALADNTRKTEQLLLAFPAGDTDGHRRYHESVIEWRELRNKLVRESLLKVAQATTLAGFGWIAVAVWQYLKISVKQ